jgi:hypothetical protein
VGDEINKQDTTCRKAVSTEERVLVTLRGSDFIPTSSQFYFTELAYALG